ncbi:RNA polymerase sigma-70 factor (ECF subfamily) [Micromonospora kangleipakensis]|uniref:RNA polymerase sigma factor n=1 Tax=Micromonospora kangleipakensis TaxID=1077942 RepID=A0A4Q8BDG5_9ACTN|nr:sigma-70 family RNA polymerase sigma factor [Micromonospora kangleipakensis]RZU75708.1 RNA polymerase sigma-70 factor (ECF subfamily) [Micromonospora kangleipakensis]
MDPQEQIRQVYATSAARLVAQVYAMTGDYAEAQDVVQEAFVRALARPGQLRQVENPEAWLRTVALNVARSRFRRRSILHRIARSGRLHLAEQSAPALSPDHVALVAALQKLPRQARETVVLHHLADLPVTEVAAAMGCSVEAVKTRLVRARRALAGHLAETEPAGPVHTLVEREARHA